MKFFRISKNIKRFKTYRTMSKTLQMSLKREWFEMTKAGIKTEDYREITDYWKKRFLKHPFCEKNYSISEIITYQNANQFGVFKKFDTNKMTLGYPSSGDKERIIEFEHKGIEIRTGNPEWGAEEGKLYFVIKHGKKIEQ